MPSLNRKDCAPKESMVLMGGKSWIRSCQLEVSRAMAKRYWGRLGGDGGIGVDYPRFGVAQELLDASCTEGGGSVCVARRNQKKKLDTYPIPSG